MSGTKPRTPYQDDTVPSSTEFTKMLFRGTTYLKMYKNKPSLSHDLKINELVVLIFWGFFFY